MTLAAEDKLKVRQAARQKAFDTALAHMRKQGSMSQTCEFLGGIKTIFGGCMYRGEYDTKCAIGALMPDEAYRQEFEGSPIEELPNLSKILPEHYQAGIEFLSDLQVRLHDQIVVIFSLTFHATLEQCAANFARGWNIDYAPP